MVHPTIFSLFCELRMRAYTVKPRIHEHTKWFANCSQTVCEPNGRMCGRYCKSALRHPPMVCIPFAKNQNLSVFCPNTKRTGCAGCPFHAPGVPCSPEVHRKLINCAPLTCCTWMAQRISSTLVYTKLNANVYTVPVRMHGASTFTFKFLQIIYR